MIGRRHKVETIPRDDRLLVVVVGQEGMKNVVGATRHVGVIAEEPASEPVSTVYRMCSHRASNTRGQVCHHVIEPGVVNVGADSEAVDPAYSGRACGIG